MLLHPRGPQNLDVAIVDCAPDGGGLTGAFDEEMQAPFGRRRGGVRIVQLEDLMRGGSLRRLRAEVDRLAADNDVVLFDAPSPTEGGDASAIMEVVDTIVPVFQAADLDRNYVAAVSEALFEYDSKLAGIVLIGDVDAG